MARDQKKMVDKITSMDEDFAKWYTDICKKAELIEYTSVKDMPFGKISVKFLTVCLKKRVTKTFVCRCSYPKAFCKRKKTTLRDLPPNVRG